MHRIVQTTIVMEKKLDSILKHFEEKGILEQVGNTTLFLGNEISCTSGKGSVVVIVNKHLEFNFDHMDNVYYFFKGLCYVDSVNEKYSSIDVFDSYEYKTIEEINEEIHLKELRDIESRKALIVDRFI